MAPKDFKELKKLIRESNVPERIKKMSPADYSG